MQRIREYLWAFGADWVALMSGIASVTLGIGSALSSLPPWTFWVASALCFIGASFRIWLNERKKVESLQTQLSNVGTIEQSILLQKLTELADYGTVHIQNKPVQNEHDVHILWYEYGKWEYELLQTMKQGHCKVSDISRVRTLDTFTPKNLSGITPFHAQVREWIAEQVLRVRAIIKQLEEAP